MLDGGALREHTLNRLGYGQSTWHAARFDELGFDGYVDEQLGGSLPALTETQTENQNELVSAKLEAAVTERRQLETALMDFWFNHLNVEAANGFGRRNLRFYLWQVIKPNLLGSFGAMLLASAQSPSMLDYLDNRANFAEDGSGRGPNENYARELMELHTLGVDGGYSEADIVDVARLLTGWTIATQNNVNTYIFRANRHDRGAKTVMGVSYPAGRNEVEGIELLAFLAAHPSTANFIGLKLCRRLVSESPPASVVSTAASAFQSSGGDLGAVTRAIVTSSEFKDDAALRAKVKPPLRYIASALQAMGVTAANEYAPMERAMRNGVAELGEEPYRVGPPTGYPEASPYWVSATTMLGRFQLAGAIASDNRLRDLLKAAAGTDGATATGTVDAVIGRMCPGGVSATTRDSAIAYVEGHANSNNDRVTDAAHAILSSPEFVRF